MEYVNVRDSALITDLYQLTMLQGYWKEGKQDEIAVFDLFYRHAPYKGSFVIAAGINEALEYVENLRFRQEELDYLLSLDVFDNEFIDHLAEWTFNGEIYSVAEGEIVPPGVPIMRVKAPIIQSQLIETALLNKINFQTLIATKASRIVYAAENCPVVDFGLRRAQGMSHLEATRASIIGGVNSTSNVLGGKEFGVPVKGTHAHSWVQSFPTELEAFKAYGRAFPRAALFLVDTYDTLEIGIPNAISAAKEAISNDPEFKFLGIRIDSGDLAYMSSKADEMLRDAGFGPDVKIVLSNNLDEFTIQSIIQQLRRRGSDQAVQRLIFGVGTKMVTGSPEPALGGVYKLVVHQGEPKMKLSSNVEKMTNPGMKEVVRIYGRDGPQFDVLVLEHDLERFEDQIGSEPSKIILHHPMDRFKVYKFHQNEVFRTRKLLTPAMKDGKIIEGRNKDLLQIQEYAKQALDEFDHSYRRLSNPHIYKVSLEKNLWDLKQELIEKGLSQKEG